MNRVLFRLSLLLFASAFANDGAYYASGNQLIPISENDVEITKEILTITRKIENEIEYVYVTVDYTFFNPNAEKTILVGFEAPSPSGDVNGFPKQGAHPYISNFAVIMNGKKLKYNTAIVNSSNYYTHNSIDAKTEEEVIGDDFNANAPDFYYVYHFNAKFTPGPNKIMHTYRCRMSGSITENFSFDYILTAANRWANHQIDDFTLHIDIGDYQGIAIKNTFFDSEKEWQMDNGRSIPTDQDHSKFIVYNGKISFQKKNFCPKGELYIQSLEGPMSNHFTTFDRNSRHNLPKKINIETTVTKAIDKNSFKILRNLPYAIRGYVFSTPFIQNYYLSQSWYRPDSKYKADLQTLSNEEKEWLALVNSKGWDK